MGEAVGDRIQGSFLTTLMKSARAAGYNPLVLLAQFDRLYARLFQGGSVQLTQTGPKDADVEVRGMLTTRFPYFRCRVHRRGARRHPVFGRARRLRQAGLLQLAERHAGDARVLGLSSCSPGTSSQQSSDSSSPSRLHGERLGDQLQDAEPLPSPRLRIRCTRSSSGWVCRAESRAASARARGRTSQASRGRYHDRDACGWAPNTSSARCAS